jgi:hypothetical protein
MWSPEVAVQLRRRGHDVVAVKERSDLTGEPDIAIFAAAQVEDRAVVTENVPDYRTLGRSARHGRTSHAGLIFTTNNRFPRHDARTVGRLVSALERLVVSGVDLTDREHWLDLEQRD